MTVLVTGGARFSGANFVLEWLKKNDEPVGNPDRLTYARNLGNFRSRTDHNRHRFVHAGIEDSDAISDLLHAASKTIHDDRRWLETQWA